MGSETAAEGDLASFSFALLTISSMSRKVGLRRGGISYILLVGRRRDRIGSKMVWFGYAGFGWTTGFGVEYV